MVNSNFDKYKMGLDYDKDITPIGRINKQGFNMTILVRGRKITIEDKLAECARKHFIDLVLCQDLVQNKMRGSAS